MKKERIDQLLVQNKFFESREQAKRAIMAGLVLVNQETILKPGTKVDVNAQIQVKKPLHPYVSRGGLKLEKALQLFPIDLQGKVVIDIGASTGGFTDCALQNGAKRVYAVDVGYGQLAWKLRTDPRVVVMERTNFRYMEPERLTEGAPQVATIDVSFISLAHIFPNLSNILQDKGIVIALIKPQFEAGRQQVGKKGIVKDPAIHRQVLVRVIKLAESNSFYLKGLTYSPILGSAGNIEFLAYFVYQKEREDILENPLSMIEETIKIAHDVLKKSKRSDV